MLAFGVNWSRILLKNYLDIKHYNFESDEENIFWIDLVPTNDDRQNQRRMF